MFTTTHRDLIETLLEVEHDEKLDMRALFMIAKAIDGQVCVDEEGYLILQTKLKLEE